MSQTNSEANDFASTFRENANTTQIVYQTLIQAASRRQTENNRGVSPTDAELFHSYSKLAVGITSPIEAERCAAWSNLVLLASDALELFTPTPAPEVSSNKAANQPPLKQD